MTNKMNEKFNSINNNSYKKLKAVAPENNKRKIKAILSKTKIALTKIQATINNLIQSQMSSLIERNHPKLII